MIALSSCCIALFLFIIDICKSSVWVLGYQIRHQRKCTCYSEPGIQNSSQRRLSRAYYFPICPITFLGRFHEPFWCYQRDSTHVYSSKPHVYDCYEKESIFTTEELAFAQHYLFQRLSCCCISSCFQAYSSGLENLPYVCWFVTSCAITSRGMSLVLFI